MQDNAIYLNGNIIGECKNLRLMRDYARKSRVAHVSAVRDTNNNHRGILHVTYTNGAECRATFASFLRMIDFVRARRSWKTHGAKYHIPENYGYLTKPGLIAGN